MEYSIYSFGLCCRNLQKSIDFYEALGCKEIKRIEDNGYSVAFLYAGNSVIIELNENPLMIEEKYFTKRKGSINSISFKVDNIYKAYKDIESKGLRVVWTPKENKGIYQFGLLDEEGMLIKIFNFVDGDFKNNHEALNIELRDICLLTNQYEKIVNLYGNGLGLKKKDCNINQWEIRSTFYGSNSETSVGIFIKEIPNNDLTDLEFNQSYTDREREYINKFGNGFEHLTFEIINKEEKAEKWLKDPDGNHIRLI